MRAVLAQDYTLTLPLTGEVQTFPAGTPIIVSCADASALCTDIFGNPVVPDTYWSVQLGDRWYQILRTEFQLEC